MANTDPYFPFMLLEREEQFSLRRFIIALCVNRGRASESGLNVAALLFFSFSSSHMRSIMSSNRKCQGNSRSWKRLFSATVAASAAILAIPSIAQANAYYDTNFSGDGQAVVSISGSQAAYALGVTTQADGKVVTVGYNTGSDWVVRPHITRLTTSGALDTTFSGDGMAELGLDIYNRYAKATDVAVRSDGKIVIAGYSWLANTPDRPFVAVMNSDGTMDSTLDGDGLVQIPIGSLSERATSVAVQSDNKIVVGGYNAGDGTGRVWRLNADGTLDTTFNSDGWDSFADNNSTDQTQDVLVGNDGSIYTLTKSVEEIDPNNLEYVGCEVDEYSSSGVKTSHNSVSTGQVSPGISTCVNLFQRSAGYIIMTWVNAAQPMAVRYDQTLSTVLRTTSSSVFPYYDWPASVRSAIQTDGSIIFSGDEYRDDTGDYGGLIKLHRLYPDDSGTGYYEDDDAFSMTIGNSTKDHVFSGALVSSGGTGVFVAGRSGSPSKISVYKVLR